MDGGKLRVGVVGGGVGQAHVRAYQSLPKRFEVIAVCDIDKAKARDALELITAIYCSSQAGQVVELPIGKDHPNYTTWRPH